MNPETGAHAVLPLTLRTHNGAKHDILAYLPTAEMADIYFRRLAARGVSPHPNNF